jgi:hypothetical protein
MTIFHCSCEYFWGYKVEILKETVGCNEDIVARVKQNLHDFLSEHNLPVLAEKAAGIHLHLHDSFDNLFRHDIVYVCDCPDEVFVDNEDPTYTSLCDVEGPDACAIWPRVESQFDLGR